MSESHQRKIPWKILSIVALLVALITASYVFPISTILTKGILFIKAQGATGIALFAALYVMATVFLIPASILTLGAGFLYGPLIGVLIVSPASVCGASLAFLLGRYFFRPSVRARFKDEQFRAIDQAIGEQGAKIVLLLRLSPIFPFNLLNYALSLTAIPLKSFVWASFLGMLPGTFLYVYSGSLIPSIVKLSSGTLPKTSGRSILYWGGLLATLVVTIWITKIAKNALGKALMKKQSNSADTTIPNVSVHVLPDDQHNRQLLNNVHPADHKNPRPKSMYNLVVIGGGTAGLVSAAGAAGLGAKVALIERQFLGGDCLNFGCVPSKAILRPAHFLSELREATNLGLNIPGEVSIDFVRMMEEMRKVRAGISHHDSVQRFTSLGVDVFLGHAQFTDKNTISVDGQKLHFKKAIIASGASSRRLAIPGAEETPLLYSENLFSQTELPKNLLVIGAGPIGCEIAQAFRSFGSSVLVVELFDRILPKDDPEAAALVLEQMKHEGIQFQFLTKPYQVEKAGEKLVLHAHQGKNSVSYSADAIFCALGRKPNLDGLGLANAGIALEHENLVVNDYLQTSNPDVFGAGDICSRFQFTHAADALARIALQNALFFGRKKASSLVIPWCTYTRPELAHVGIEANEANKRGIAFETITIPMANVDRAVLDRKTEGLLKIHYQKSNGQLLGGTAVSSDAGDLINTISLLIANNMAMKHVQKAIFSYPTKSEILKRVADAYNRTRLTPGVASLMKRFLKLRRL